MEMKFESNSLAKRLKSMVSVDFRRMFTTPLFYIMAGICFVIPILILVMTTVMDGAVSVDPNTGAVTTIEAFDSTWQIIGSVSGEDSDLSMDFLSMCNINLLYFLAAVFVCLFVGGDFQSGYAKNLFAVRAKKNDYVISKTLAGFACGVCMLLAFFAGAMLGGAIAGLPFDTGAASAAGIAMCLLSKMFLMAVFVSIDVLLSVTGKQKLWLSLVCSLCAGMLFFTVIPMMTPLDSSLVNVVLCLAGGALCSAGFGAVSGTVLKKTNLV